ncbi:DNA translocase FtsK, partial [Sulfurimonas sp. SAG-AH-194-I05]|nr:DNA translocase FtsK [Sulfurimonas sp. SAG-AH-194-I05]
MRDTILIIVFSVLVYLGFATIFGNSGLMGSYGSIFAIYNHAYFGYISFVYLLVLIYPLYLVYKDFSFNFRRAELSVAVFLSFFSLLLAQSMLIENEYRGKFAGDFVDFLSPFIGIFGVWIFWFIITSLSVIIFADKSTQEIASTMLKYSKSLLSPKDEKEKKEEI